MKKLLLVLVLVFALAANGAVAETEEVRNARRALTEAVPAMEWTNWQWYNDREMSNTIAGLMTWFGWISDFEDNGTSFVEVFQAAGGKDCYLVCYDTPEGVGMLEYLIDCHSNLISIALAPLSGDLSYEIIAMDGEEVEDAIAAIQAEKADPGSDFEYKELSVYAILDALEKLAS